ncbi:MAG: ATP phosphoribosyltransferase regulatory subunit [Clostridia bacterium]|nr:ATP phosphoribosyltransferase regulatory subunit [Clostridia bacterium]
MQINDRVMDPQERIGFRLRSLYSDAGYCRYRMSKFEEYDLYSRNKDFLFSEGVITFTDTNGRLMALKPDVTLSIIKNGRDIPGALRRVYYHENVYRVASAEDGFREQTQVGVECMGDVDSSCVAEVLKLAAKSLELCSADYVLEISHLGILGTLTDAVASGERMREALLQCAGEKNLHGISRICQENGLAKGAEEPLKQLLNLYGPPRTVMPKIRKLAEENGAAEYADELGQAAAAFAGSDMENRIRIDFSASGDTKYYNGIVFKGFISGIPGSVLSGGQYDRLMRRMGRKDRAVGFAVFLNMLERLTEGGQADA